MPGSFFDSGAQEASTAALKEISWKFLSSFFPLLLVQLRNKNHSELGPKSYRPTCNLLSKPVLSLIEQLLIRLKCLQKLHASFHACNNIIIGSFLFLKENLLIVYLNTFFGWKVLLLITLYLLMCSWFEKAMLSKY